MALYDLTVSEVRRETNDAVSVVFEVPEPLRETFRYLPGQYLTLQAVIDGEPVRRTYSICAGPDEPLRVAIKQVPAGRFSTFANQRLTRGTLLQVGPPKGRFTVVAKPGQVRHHVAFAAGSGITPVISLVKSLLADEPRSHVTLGYGNRSVDTILFRDELCDLKDRYVDRFTVHHFLSRQPQESPLHDGRLDADRLRGLLPTLGRIDTAMICGPGDMIDTAVTALVAHGVAKDAIGFERFGRAATAPPVPEVARPAAFTAQIQLDGVLTTVTGEANETVLDAAMRAGLDLPYACRGGVCATCRARVTEGTVALEHNYALAPWELQAGFTLTCQARPQTPHVVVDFDQS